MQYIVGGLIGVAIVFSCISLVFNRRVMRELEEAKKAVMSIKQPKKEN